jgi:type IV pilus biogenesis protein PilP
MVNVKIFAVLMISAFMVSAESGSAWDLDNLQKQRVLYEAKAAVNKAKAEAESSGSSGTISDSALNRTGQVGTTTSLDILPKLVKISGHNAVVSTQDGNTATLSQGQLLPGGRWQVISIGLNGVKVRNISDQRIQTIN